jgi:hypothetical protein
MPSDGKRAKGDAAATHCQTSTRLGTVFEKSVTINL